MTHGFADDPVGLAVATEGILGEVEIASNARICFFTRRGESPDGSV